jgi:hypothetical protein
MKVKDYCPISLIHIMGKLLSRVLASRLAPKLNSLVHISQSAFIIEDNFKSVQSSDKLLHVRKHASLHLKVDIAKAFDLVAWPFLHEIMEHLSFSGVWRHWTSILLSTASTRILMNRTPREKICHARGSQQGDPYNRCCSCWSWRFWAR